MKRLSTIVATLASILLILILIFSMLQLTINSETFINNEFTKLGVAKSMGMNNADLVRATMQLIDYMEGRVPSINIDVTIDGAKEPMFALEQEHSHMADVRVLYQTFRTGRDLAILAMLVLFLLAALMGFRRTAQTFASGYLSGLFACALVFGFVGVWALLDFSGFWTFFHQMLFWNEDWLFDATTSRMINMLPEQMFADIIARMAIYSVIAIGLLAVIAIITVAGAARKRRKARERAEERRLAAIERKKQLAEAEKQAAEAALRPQVPADALDAAPAAPEVVPEPAKVAPEKKRRTVVGDEIPGKPKNGAERKRRAKKPAPKAEPAAKQEKIREASASDAPEAPAKRKRKPVKEKSAKETRVKEKPRRLRRGDAPFELNLDAVSDEPDGEIGEGTDERI